MRLGPILLLLLAAALLQACASAPPEPDTVNQPSPEMAAEAAEPAREPAISNGRVNASAVNLRSEASTKSAILGKLQKNQAVEVLRVEGSWSKVRAGESTGWIASKFLKNASGCRPDAEFTFVKSPVPAFPESGVKGTVVVEATVSTAGVVTRTQITRNTTGDSAISAAVEREIRAATFNPPVRNCRPRSFIYAYTRTF